MNGDEHLDLQPQTLRSALALLAADLAAGVPQNVTLRRVLSEIGYPEIEQEFLGKSVEIAARSHVEPPTPEFEYTISWWPYAHGYLCRVQEYPALESLGGTPGEAIDAMNRQIAHAVQSQGEKP
jgi:hypothetical protein